MTTACTDPSPRCIEPDDFGYPKFQVYSERADVDVINYPDDPHRLEDEADMVSEWEYSGYMATGAHRLVITTETVEGSDRWTGWYEGDPDYMEDDACDCDKTCPDSLDSDEAPCWFEYGCGLFMLVMPVKGDNREKKADGLPDLKELDTAADPPAPPFSVFHLGYQGEDYYLNQQPPRGRLYFKILDSYYNDNKGSYLVRMKEGAIKPEYGIALQIFTWIQDILDTITVRAYEDIVQNSEWKKTVQAALVLYIIVTSIAFMVGMVKVTQAEFLLRIVKFAIVATVISDTSWDFFNDMFFKLFTQGGVVLMGEYMMASTAATIDSRFSVGVTYDAWYPIEFFDRLIEMAISQETIHKVISLVFTSFWGIIFVAALTVALVIWLVALVKGIVLYILAIFVLSLLIIIFPVFLCFWLFHVTRDIFMSYLKTVVAYALQPVLMFAFLGLFTGIVMYYMHQALGYRVCWQSWWDLQLSLAEILELLTGLGITSLFPDVAIPIYDFKYYLFDLGIEERISDIGSFRCDDSSTAVLKQVAKEFPYLDPADPAECRRIKEMMDGDYIGYTQVLVFLLASFLMFKFGNQIVPIVKGITAQAGAQDLSQAAAQVSSRPAASLAGKAAGQAASAASKGATKKSKKDNSLVKQAGKQVAQKAAGKVLNKATSAIKDKMGKKEEGKEEDKGGPKGDAGPKGGGTSDAGGGADDIGGDT